MARRDQGAWADRRRGRVGCGGHSGRAPRSRQGRLSALVLDASVLANLLIDSPRSQRLAWRLDHNAPVLHAPSVCDLEIASYIRGMLRQRKMTETAAGDVLGRYLALPIERHDHRPLLGRILELRDSLTAYDAAYVALAERLDAPLATTDRRLALVARGLGLEVQG